jgi:hypothetical protein
MPKKLHYSRMFDGVLRSRSALRQRSAPDLRKHGARSCSGSGAPPSAPERAPSAPPAERSEGAATERSRSADRGARIAERAPLTGAPLTGAPPERSAGGARPGSAAPARGAYPLSEGHPARSRGDLLARSWTTRSGLGGSHPSREFEGCGVTCPSKSPPIPNHHPLKKSSSREPKPRSEWSKIWREGVCPHPRRVYPLLAKYLPS